MKSILFAVAFAFIRIAGAFPARKETGTGFVFPVPAKKPFSRG